MFIHPDFAALILSGDSLHLFSLTSLSTSLLQLYTLLLVSFLICIPHRRLLQFHNVPPIDLPPHTAAAQLKKMLSPIYAKQEKPAELLYVRALYSAE